MHNSQGRITVFDFVDDDAYAPHIVDLVEINSLAFHLPINAVDMFGTPCHFGLNAFFLQCLPQDVNDFGNVLFSVSPSLGDEPGYLLIFFGLQVTER